MKWILGIFSVALIAQIVNPDEKFQSRYKGVESYEVRSGILATPTYGKNGVLCRISLEKRHVQPDIVEMSPTIPSKLTQEIIDELAPPSERGPRSRASGPFDYEIINGSVAVLPLNYENVSVDIYRETSSQGDTAVILTWDKACSSISKPQTK